MKTPLLLLPLSALLASTAAAQADYSFQIDTAATSFTWSGTTSLGDIDEQPPNFTLVGNTVLTMNTGGNPVGSGAFADAGSALVTPNIHGEVPNLFPWLPPLATFDLTNAQFRISSPSFAVSGSGGFTTQVTVTVISGLLTTVDILNNTYYTDLTGEVSNPETASGTITWSVDHYHLAAPISAVFDFVEPSTGITGTLTVAGNLYANHDPVLPIAYCPGLPNSVGAGAVLIATGTTSLGNADLVLETSAIPTNQFGIYFYGSGTTDLPFGNGRRCIASPIIRTGAINSGPSGVASRLITNATLPAAGQVSVGDTRYFQFWYRDPAGGGAQFNLSNGLEVSFTP